MEKIPDSIPETGCCKKFIPDPWVHKEINFNQKLFAKAHVTSLFHIPLNYGRVMQEAMSKIEKAGANCVNELVLTDENSLWGADLYIAVDRIVPDLTMKMLSGTFISNVYEGPFKNIGNWVKEMQTYVASKNRGIKKLYFYYTTCPACAKVYGKNFVVLMAQV